MRRKPRQEPMPERFEILATYNAQVYRGIVHAPEWQAMMAVLQAEYNDWIRARDDWINAQIDP